MSDTPLFPDLPEVLSPRLAWIREHKVLTYHAMVDADITERYWLAAFDDGRWAHENAADFFFHETSHNGDSRCGIGDTEDEAILDLCAFHSGIKHWSLQP